MNTRDIQKKSTHFERLWNSFRLTQTTAYTHTITYVPIPRLQSSHIGMCNNLLELLLQYLCTTYHPTTVITASIIIPRRAPKIEEMLIISALLSPPSSVVSLAIAVKWTYMLFVTSQFRHSVIIIIIQFIFLQQHFPIIQYCTGVIARALRLCGILATTMCFN